MACGNVQLLETNDVQHKLPQQARDGLQLLKQLTAASSIASTVSHIG